MFAGSVSRTPCQPPSRRRQRSHLITVPVVPWAQRRKNMTTSTMRSPSRWSPDSFGTAKRDPDSFGTAKRDPDSFGTAKRDPDSFGT
jgi:hypothetical protein